MTSPSTTTTSCSRTTTVTAVTTVTSYSQTTSGQVIVTITTTVNSTVTLREQYGHKVGLRRYHRDRYDDKHCDEVNGRCRLGY